MNNPSIITIIFLGGATVFVLLICLGSLLALSDKRSGTTDTERNYEQEPIDENDEHVRLYDSLVDYIDPDTLEALNMRLIPMRYPSKTKRFSIISSKRFTLFLTILYPTRRIQMNNTKKNSVRPP